MDWLLLISWTCLTLVGAVMVWVYHTVVEAVVAGTVAIIEASTADLERYHKQLNG